MKERQQACCCWRSRQVCIIKKKCTHITIWTRDKAAKNKKKRSEYDELTRGSSCTGNFWSTNMRDRAKIGSNCGSCKQNSSDGTQIYRKILIRGFGRSNISSIRLIFLIFASVLNFQHSGCDESTNDFQKISKLSLSGWESLVCTNERWKKRLLTTALHFFPWRHDWNSQITHGFTKISHPLIFSHLLLLSFHFFPPSSFFFSRWHRYLCVRMCARTQLPVPTKVIWAIQNNDVEIPCDISPPIINDQVKLVLWFKDTDAIPMYSLDSRKGGSLKTGEFNIFLTPHH